MIKCARFSEQYRKILPNPGLWQARIHRARSSETDPQSDLSGNRDVGHRPGRYGD